MKKTSKIVGIISLVIILFSCFISSLKVSASSNTDDYTEITHRELYNDSIIDINKFIPYQENNARSASNTYYANYKYQLLNGQFVYYTLYVQFYSELLYTPNGTDVALPRNSDPRSYYVLKYLNDLPNEVKNDLEIVNNQFYNGISLISQATTSYNCHSYAWHSQDTFNNDIWISYPNAYYLDSDESYERVYDPKIGDIICYMDLDQEEEYQNIHSGVIVDYSGEDSNNICGDSNKYIIKSKWGQNGLYQHKGDDCPYTSKYEGDGADAEEVWYFRRVKHTYSLGNYTSNINKSFNINSNMELPERYEMWKLDVNYTKYYEFNINANNVLDVRLYDENMQLMEILDLNNDLNHVHFIEQLYDTKTYYLRVSYANEENIGTINTQIVSRTTYYIGVGDNDVLLNTHNYNEGIYPNNYYYYINNSGVGFYRFTLTGIKTDGTEVTYPSSAIMIKNHMNEDIIDKYSLTGYSNQAISGYNENSFVAYLGAKGYFYVYIDINTEDLKSLTLNIEPVESETIDLFTKSESSNSTMEIIDSETTKGDYAKEIILKQTGKFTIDYSYSGSQSNNILFVLSKLNYNSSSKTYSIETLISQLIDGTNDSFTYTLNLTEGTYFVAYFNKDDNAAFDVTFNRLVTQSGSAPLIPDPDYGTDGGSQVNIYEKALLPSDRSYRGTNIVVGFTRVIYIDYHYVDQYSREDYYWYSSNDLIATVSQHGTVFAKASGTVKIMAVNKDNPSIVFIKQFTVVRDTKTYTGVIYNEINDTHKLSEGKYQLGLTVQNSPYPMAQYYSWRVVSKSSTITSVSIDSWGNVTIVGTGNIVIEGYDYRYNENYGVRINLTVTN